jgi:hypothetical protein
MFYVYKNTTEDSEVIAQFTDSDSALLYMEHLALSTNDPKVTGYSVRDYALKTLADYES